MLYGHTIMQNLFAKAQGRPLIKKIFYTATAIFTLPCSIHRYNLL